MSGHSKWHNIQQRKGVADKKRSKIFSQVSKQIRVAVKEGKSGDPRFNPALRLALEKARMANMPKANVDRAIDRGLGKGKAGAIQEIVYEGFGPNGIGLLIFGMTDNPQRTAAEIRAVLTRGGGSLAGPGAVMYMFERQGDNYKVTIPMEVEDIELQQQLEDLMDTLRESEDVEDVYTVGTWPGQEE